MQRSNQARFVILLLVLGSQGCVRSYSLPAIPQESTATVKFEVGDVSFTQLEFGKKFKLEVSDFGEEGCPGKWRRGGELLGRVQLEREGDRTQIQVPAQRRIFFLARYNSATLGTLIYCNLDYGFVPKPQHVYSIEHSGNRRTCNVKVTDETTGEPVTLMGRDRCEDQDFYPLTKPGTDEVVQPEPNSCLSEVVARRYFHEMRERIFELWKLPEEVTIDEVHLIIRVSSAGKLLGVESVPGGDPRLADSAVQAVRRAAPFPPMPEKARCLSDRPLRAVFRKAARD